MRKDNETSVVGCVQYIGHGKHQGGHPLKVLKKIVAGVGTLLAMNTIKGNAK
jgi:hypothetical protein